MRFRRKHDYLRYFIAISISPLHCRAIFDFIIIEDDAEAKYRHLRAASCHASAGKTFRLFSLLMGLMMIDAR